MTNEPKPAWGDIKPQVIPPVRRGTHKRRARNTSMHMGTFWQLSHEDRQMEYAISKAGRRSS